MRFPCYDAHNHLQDERLEPYEQKIFESLHQEGVLHSVVNGTQENDWPKVAALAGKYSFIISSFGLHPWYISNRTSKWKESLRHYLNHPRACLGEAGLDHWIENRNDLDQEDVFITQLEMASERNLPLSIHCLKAWGKLLEILQRGPVPERGFLLHSYGGSVEMIKPLQELGAYFSISGGFAHERKTRQKETFRQIPLDRLLVETDAPDMPLPEELVKFRVESQPHDQNQPLNHPANIRAIYQFAAHLLELPIDKFALQIESNFKQFFGQTAVQK